MNIYDVFRCAPFVGSENGGCSKASYLLSPRLENGGSINISEDSMSSRDWCGATFISVFHVSIIK